PEHGCRKIRAASPPGATAKRRERALETFLIYMVRDLPPDWGIRWIGWNSGFAPNSSYCPNRAGNWGTVARHQYRCWRSMPRQIYPTCVNHMCKVAAAKIALNQLLPEGSLHESV